MCFDLRFCLLDNAHVTQSRLILLDAVLIFFMSLTIYAYIRFRKLRYRYKFDHILGLKLVLNVFYSEFSTEWCTWLALTGVFMACTWGSKVNGILTVFAIGFAVLIDLWDILDVHKEGHTMVKFHLL